jgi:AbrB family looped-hinge helix DNA binding protein
MAVFEKIVRISRKGRLALPKAARDALGNEIVGVMVAEDGTVSIKPMP